MKLVIDIGNTNTKVAIFDRSNELKILDIEPSLSNKGIVKNFISKHTIDHVIVSSVISTQATDQIFTGRDKLKTFILLSYNTKINFNNMYGTNKCGTDRIAAVAGAWNKFTNQSSLVITGGTCITFDFIDKYGNYKGGAISPGLNMRFRALSKFTAALPVIEQDIAYDKLIGSNTRECILSGVQLGLQAELLGIINKYTKQNIRVDNIIVNGGDADILYKMIKQSEEALNLHAYPNLTLEGLNAILNLNLNND